MIFGFCCCETVEPGTCQLLPIVDAFTNADDTTLIAHNAAYYHVFQGDKCTIQSNALHMLETYNDGDGFFPFTFSAYALRCFQRPTASTGILTMEVTLADDTDKAGYFQLYNSRPLSFGVGIAISQLFGGSSEWGWRVLNSLVSPTTSAPSVGNGDVGRLTIEGNFSGGTQSLKYNAYINGVSYWPEQTEATSIANADWAFAIGRAREAFSESPNQTVWDDLSVSFA